MDARTFIEKLRWRKRDYQLTFAKNSPPAQRVLADLAYFCYADRSTFDADPRVHAAAEGRREVWLWINSHLNLSSEELFAMIRQGQAEQRPRE
jgi:hypothetical protein